MENKFYITTPIYYVNDKPHIGHAYTTVLADVLARWRKLQGKEVFFLTGTDEHGAKIEEAAQKAGKEPQEFCDEKAKEFENAWEKLNIQYDNFIRTTDEAHKKAVQSVLQTLKDNNLIYEGHYEGFYCPGCEQYKFIDDLIDGKCPEHQIELEITPEDSWFFKLGIFEDRLKEKIKSDEIKIKPTERKNEILNFIESSLNDISVSRKNVKWGIKLPFDENFTIYVWVDAFLNYLTGLGWDGKIPLNPPLEKGEIKFFPPDVQLMSKDILRVHATIWPAILLALDIPPPWKLFVHGFFTINGQKMSKSLGNVISPDDLIEKFGADGARYLLMSSLAYGHDGDISWEKLTEKYNADLVNGLGNLISRTIKLAQIAKIKAQNHSVKLKDKKIKNLDILFNEIKPKEILEVIWQQVHWANKYIEEKKLWELVKNNEVEAGKILEELYAAIYDVAKNLKPFMPETVNKITKILEAGKIKKGEVLFPRV